MSMRLGGSTPTAPGGLQEVSHKSALLPCVGKQLEHLVRNCFKGKKMGAASEVHPKNSESTLSVSTVVRRATSQSSVLQQQYSV